MSTRKRIGFLVYDGITALDLTGPAEAFACAAMVGARGERRAAYEVVTIGLDRRACASESGVTIVPATTIATAPTLDTLIVPGGSGLREPITNRKFAAWIAERAPRVRRVASVCTGIYGLAPTGLLDGRRVTTHWNFAADVATRFLKLDVASDELFVKSDRFYTAAGVTSGIDLALALIEEDLGAAAALAVARELVVYVKRDGGQAQFSEPLQFQAGARERFGELAAHITANLARDLRVDALADKMAVSARQFSRQCHANFGCSPAALVRRLRLDEARRRLHARAGGIARIAASVGFRSADAFTRAFERQFGINPSEYRARFEASALGSPRPSAHRGIARRAGAKPST
jgi:transcriptional regulator GlxA family with amidase domain